MRGISQPVSSMMEDLIENGIYFKKPNYKTSSVGKSPINPRKSSLPSKIVMKDLVSGTISIKRIQKRQNGQIKIEDVNTADGYPSSDQSKDTTNKNNT